MPATKERIGTRDRIVYASAELFRRQGYTGTGLKQVVAQAEAPFGSLYHFFPGGKEQLADEVIRQGGRFFGELFRSIAEDAPDVVTAVAQWFDGAAQTLRDTGYADACPIATVALEVASTSEPLRQATADVFESWLDGAAAFFATAGIPDEKSRELAITVVAALEGAFVLSRATRSTEHVDAAGRAAVAAVRAELPG
jgi:AcrR family transcriptional regulator